MLYRTEGVRGQEGRGWEREREKARKNENEREIE